MHSEMNSVIKTLLDTAEQLEAALEEPSVNDMIYAWNNGLAVKFIPGTDPKVVGVLQATPALPGIVLLNGKSEVARHMLRSRAIRIAIENVLTAVSNLEKKV